MNGILSGVLVGWVGVYVALGVSFAAAFWRQRQEVAYLVFALLTAALAVYTIGCAGLYADPDPVRAMRPLALASAGAIAGATIALHFALVIAEVRRPLRVMAAPYAIAAFFEVAVATGHWVDASQARVDVVHVLGREIATVRAPITPVAWTFYAIAPALIVATTWLLGRAYLRGRAEALAAFLGCLLVAVTGIGDALGALGIWPGVQWTPHSYVVFAFGVASTLIGRYAALGGELERSTVELKQRARDLARAYADVSAARSAIVKKEQLAAVGELSAVVAHEVRNPLAAIANAATSLRHPALAPADRETLLALLDEETARLNRLVGDVLAYARPIVPEKKPVSLRGVLERALACAARDGLEMELSGDEEVIWGDPLLLRQVFDNLVHNGSQAMASGGKLVVSLARETKAGARGVTVRIADTGEGMDTAVRTRARDPFFTTRRGGTGLGLAIVDRHVAAHGGELSIRSRSGEGTVVTVFLPVGSEG